MIAAEITLQHIQGASHDGDSHEFKYNVVGHYRRTIAVVLCSLSKTCDVILETLKLAPCGGASSPEQTLVLRPTLCCCCE